MKTLKFIGVLSMVLFLAACGSNLEGTYGDQLGMVKYTFNSNGKVIMSTGAGDVEFDYEMDDDKIRIKAAQGQSMILTLEKDGSISGGIGGGKLTKKE